VVSLSDEEVAGSILSVSTLISFIRPVRDPLGLVKTIDYLID
jgi:hypothetical protein